VRERDIKSRVDVLHDDVLHDDVLHDDVLHDESLIHRYWASHPEICVCVHVCVCV